MVCSFVSALFGSWESLMGGSFSYIANMCQDGQQKTQRMAGIELVMGVFTSAASVSSGYFLRAAGFNWPFFTSSLLYFSNLLYVVFVLEETVKLPESRDVQEGGLRAPLLKIANGVRQVFVSASRRKNTMLVLLHLAFMVVTVCNNGTASVLILYELNEPLCWSEILIGYGSALSTTSCLISFAGVFILSRCLPDLVIVLIGLLSIVTWLTMAAFTKTTQLMLLVRVPMVLSIMPAPVIRSMMSKITPKSDQGALFACVAFVESLSISMGSIAFSSLYAATVSWFPGFCFLLAAGLCLSSMALMGAVGTLGSNAATETEGLVSGEETDS
ncbi:hypothetical protein SKAU_G00085620 [Synaphobranchus kaupii]|uniref:Solute carrier family 46 member 3 n=1 Tax=Synaphobranchus kaupii TaxID=118154 RepID=A0A9Q1FW71_SYNKA|nr:hypothetical protein SKAU_G00085620 [Synaphobranchus kaupii]